MDASFSGDTEGKMLQGEGKRGNWVTFPFIISTIIASTLANGGWIGNLIVYLISKFNITSIDAAQIFNVVNGCSSLLPVIGAILADSFLGSFWVITISSWISLLGSVLLASTSLVDSLRPSPCQVGLRVCQTPSGLQFAVLYAAIAMASIGYGGLRFTLVTMGANQFEKSEDQSIFINWYFNALSIANVIGGTAIIYIEDNVRWGLGFGLCAAASFIGVVSFLLGNRYYRNNKPNGSPFTGLARVVFASIRKRNAALSSTEEDYYHVQEEMTKEVAITTTKGFRFLNRAALKSEGDLKPDGSIARPWRLCSVQQVEDLKRVIRTFPLWSTSIFLSIATAVQFSLVVLQALTMDRHLGQNFRLPAGSITIVAFLSSSISLALINWCLDPIWHKLTNKFPTPIKRMGIGHIFVVLALAVSALVELKRLRIAHGQDQKKQTNSTVPMSVFWLFPQLILLGTGEAFHVPGQIAFYYQQFPSGLRSTATALLSLLIGMGYYLSSALIDILRRVTDWLPDNINHGRVENIYWMLAVVGVLNFGCFLVCAKLYKVPNC